jgi:hypothetical protein
MNMPAGKKILNQGRDVLDILPYQIVVYRIITRY